MNLRILLVHVTLVITAFVIGWQTTEDQNQPELPLMEFNGLVGSGWNHEKTEIIGTINAGDQVDILVRDESGRWRTLAFAAKVEPNLRITVRGIDCDLLDERCRTTLRAAP